MNERIKQLAEQAGGYVSLSYEHDGKLILSGEDIVEKFAELIVKACAGICKETAEKQFSPLYNRESDGATICYKKIKEHFGVEE